MELLLKSSDQLQHQDYSIEVFEAGFS